MPLFEKGHTTGSVRSLAFNTNGLLASGSDDKTIRLWNPNTGTHIRALTGHTSSVISVAFNQNILLASGSADYTIKLWNTDTGALVRTLTGMIRQLASFFNY